MEDRKDFGRNIKIYRKNLHLTQEVLAEKLDINFSNITKIESGQQFVSANILYKLAEVLNVTVSDLFKTEHPQYTAENDTIKQKLMKYIFTLNEEEALLAYENIRLCQKYMYHRRNNSSHKKGK